MNLPDHLDHLRALLDAERAEERARLDEARARLSLAEREARGLALADVEAAEEGALAGRALVGYERRGAPLDGARLGVGALVTVTLRREPRDDEPSGVVARRTRTRVSVLFDEPPPDWAVDGRVVLELTPSPVTWERLSAGVRRMGEAPEGRRWHRVLGGEPFDLVFSDLQMPEMTGMDLHRELARSRPDLASRMVFLTGGACTDAARDFLMEPGRECLEKPFDLPAIRAVLARRLAAPAAPATSTARP